MEKRNGKLMAQFLIPSIIGIILFMIPVKYDGSWTIFVKILADKIGGALGNYLPMLCVIIVTVSAVMSVLALAKPKFITESKRSFCGNTGLGGDQSHRMRIHLADILQGW